MICLAVSNNGTHLCLAGDPDAIVMAELSSGTHIGNPPRPGFALTVGASTAGGLVEWARRDLFIGDEVLIKVIQSSDVDSPTRVLTHEEFEGLADKRGLLLARGEYAALKRRMRVLEREYGERLRGDEDA